VQSSQVQDLRQDHLGRMRPARCECEGQRSRRTVVPRPRQGRAHPQWLGESAVRPLTKANGYPTRLDRASATSRRRVAFGQADRGDCPFLSRG